jgi:hypothetical protein
VIPEHVATPVLEVGVEAIGLDLARIGDATVDERDRHGLFSPTWEAVGILGTTIDAVGLVGRAGEDDGDVAADRGGHCERLRAAVRMLKRDPTPTGRARAYGERRDQLASVGHRDAVDEVKGRIVGHLDHGDVEPIVAGEAGERVRGIDVAPDAEAFGANETYHGAYECSTLVGRRTATVHTVEPDAARERGSSCDAVTERELC